MARVSASPATAEQPVRVKGAWAILASNVAIAVLLGGILVKAGLLQHEAAANTADINTINEALAKLAAISSDVLEGRDADRATLHDIRERLRTLEAKR